MVTFPWWPLIGDRRPRARPPESQQACFIHPLNNPSRVDPILVPAGDFVWPEGKG